jgi:hypothetical protein
VACPGIQIVVIVGVYNGLCVGILDVFECFEGGRTIYRTLSPKRHLFKLGLTDDPTCERCLEEDEPATHMLCACEAIAYLRFRHLGQFFYGTM